MHIINKKVMPMFNKLKMKFAARRVNRNHRARRNTRRNARPTFWGRVWNIICAPFRLIARLCKRIWAWIRGIDLVGLLNLTLLVAIIVLFSMLIIDIVKCRRETVVVVSDPVPVVAENVQPKIIVEKTPALPIPRDEKTGKFVAEPVRVVPVKKEPVVEQQTARIDTTIYGDTIIDSRGSGAILTRGTQIRGNLYIQNMHKFILPCDVVIYGDLFLRDMGLLQFCGDFTVTGNIYVSPRSSFGPIPRTARIGGQVIL